MARMVEHFQRDASGAWRCMEPATLELPSGRIQVSPGRVFTPGAKFMNVDIAALLDEEYQKRQRGR